jgi:pimeloyl-ACP methyl ester carboxylesterase
MSRARTVGRVAAGTAAAAAAAGGGLFLDRRRRRTVPGDHPPFGSLHGDEHTVKAEDGLLLHAEVDEMAPYGSEANHDDRATVVFVHGFSLNSQCWHFQRLAFRGKRRLVFFDQRSHGRSGRAEHGTATIDQLGRDLLTVLDTLTPSEPVVLVGHSMGGMSIVALAEQHPELFGDRVVGVALISSTAGGQRTHKMLSKHIPDAIGRRLVERGLLVAADRERVLELVRRSGSAIALRVIREFAFGDEPVPRSYVEFLDSMIAATPLKVLVEFIPQFDALDKFHVVAALANVPTWIMCGTKDRLTSIDHARKLHDCIPGSQLVEFRGGGHMPIFEHKERVNETLDLLFEDADRLIGDRG